MEHVVEEVTNMTNDILGIVAIPVITIIVFIIAEAIKATALDEKWLPVICGVCGGCIGILAMKVMPDFPAHDPLTAIAVGIVSGLASTGVHQIYVQLFRKESAVEVIEPPDKYKGRH